jgi:putative membrane protein
MLIEPVAYHVKSYWLWQASDGYYGIPWSNFVTWLVASFAMILAMAVLLKPEKRPRWEWLPIALFVCKGQVRIRISISFSMSRK